MLIVAFINVLLDSRHHTTTGAKKKKKKKKKKWPGSTRGFSTRDAHLAIQGGIQNLVLDIHNQFLKKFGLTGNLSGSLGKVSQSSL